VTPLRQDYPRNCRNQAISLKIPSRALVEGRTHFLSSHHFQTVKKWREWWG
jgi:hypothetical protein